MKRRDCLRRTIALTGAALAPAGRLWAQPDTRARRIGVLNPYADSPTSPLNLFAAALARAGYVVGRDLHVDRVYADGYVDRLPRLAQALLARDAELIVAVGNNAVAAAKQATSKVPIVMAFGIEPVVAGLVADLARPGGNVTGVTWLSAEVAGKALELLREVVPGLARLAVLGNPAVPGMHAYRAAFANAASRMGLVFSGHAVSTPDDVAPMLERIAAARPQALYVTAEPATEAHVEHIAAFALRHKLPTIGVGPRLVEAGGLLYYGPDLREMVDRVVALMDRVLHGAKPAELPIEQPSRYDPTVNQRTARTLGIALPNALLLRATRVIE